jgi:hypothetical protein
MSSWTMSIKYIAGLLFNLPRDRDACGIESSVGCSTGAERGSSKWHSETAGLEGYAKRV